MKAVGLITEYNPLHNGHLYHINEAKKITQADCVIAVMSGDFVQRGEPAVISKYARAAAAIEAGINLCIELPSYYALSSAEQFADGGIRMLQALQCDSIVFGSECGNIDALSAIAKILTNEPATFQELLKNELASGKSFPLARQSALHKYCEKEQIVIEDSVLSKPNNILGIEYLKSIYRHQFSMTAHTITRNGTGYHETAINGLPSASAIRMVLTNSLHENILQNSKCPPIHSANQNISSDSTQENNKIDIFASNIDKLLPPAMAEQIQNNFHSLITFDDCTPLFQYKMESIFYQNHYQKETITVALNNYYDMTKELAYRMAEQFRIGEPLSDFCMRIKSRQYTYSRISRCICHILLDMTKEKAQHYTIGSAAPYIRILGFDSIGQKYLSQIKKTCDAPIITKPSAFAALLEDDIHAASLYQQLVYHKSGICLPNELRRGVYRKSES